MVIRGQFIFLPILKTLYYKFKTCLN